MKISHEVPLELLEWSKTVNDYEYVLPYFYKRYPEYKEFYLQCKKEGRFSILDNGLFEGETYTNDELIKFIKELTPDIFIVPDEWDDYMKTHDHAKRWAEYGKFNTNVNLMVVLQGETYEEIRRLYKWCYNLGYRYFALNHSSTAYNKLFPHKNFLVSKMMGRIQTVHQMAEVFHDDVYVHLLGASLPQEFMYYEGYDFIKSIDTSNPILHGAKGEYYNKFGMTSKPKEKMEVFFDKEVMTNIDYIKDNVYYFRRMIEKK